MVHTILVAFDGSEPGERALQTALEWGETFGAEVHAIYVAEMRGFLSEYLPSQRDLTRVSQMIEEEGMRMERRIAIIASRNAQAVRTHRKVGDPRREILALAEIIGADLIMIGSRGRSGLKELLLGSVSSFVAGNSPVPTVLVP
ncbi:MAG: universal stress protein [Methanomicrobiaceae archaeon]|nr:universal stress protein [Methanomicrobiaceae archaeon]